jgi:hypothetical protein
MANTKRLFSFMLTVFFIVSAVAAQDSGGAAPQQGSLNLMVFKGIYGPDGLTIRKRTLESISEAVSQGNTSDEIYAALEYLSMEGLKNKTMEKGQVLNNFPDIRQMVAAQLGRMGTAKATELLIQLCNAEKNDLYVLQETIKALGDIGINENDNTIKNIVWNVRNFNPSRPDSIIDRVMLSAVDAMDKIERKNNGIKNQKDFKDVQDFLKRVSDGHFSTPVRDRAKHVLEEMLKRNTQRKQET